MSPLCRCLSDQPSFSASALHPFPSFNGKRYEFWVNIIVFNEPHRIMHPFNIISFRDTYVSETELDARDRYESGMCIPQAHLHHSPVPDELLRLLLVTDMYLSRLF